MNVFNWVFSMGGSQALRRMASLLLPIPPVLERRTQLAQYLLEGTVPILLSLEWRLWSHKMHCDLPGSLLSPSDAFALCRPASCSQT